MKKILPILVVLCVLLSGGLASIGQDIAIPTSVVATQQAVDQLIRSTRKDGNVREPFVLRDGPADEEEIIGTTDELETAILLIQEEDYTNAVPLLESVIDKMPTVEAIWEALGWSYYWTDRMEDADRLWRQYMALRPDSPKPYSLLAQLSILKKDWRATDEYLKRSLELEPKNYDIRYWYAQNLFRLGRLHPATAIFEELVAEDEERYDVKIDLARIYALVQRYEDSLDLWTDVVTMIPENLDLRTEYARALMMVGNLEAANQAAREILAEDPTRLQAMTIRADIAEISQQDDEMVESLKGLLEDAEDPEVAAQLRMRLANRYVLLHNKDAAKWPLTLALDQYENALDQQPDNVAWLNMYAQAALTAHKPELARQTVNRILKEFNPFNRSALRTQFEIEMFIKDFNAAERALNELYDKYQPQDPYRYLDIARLEIQRGHYQEAMDALERLEEASSRGAVLTLLYHGLTESEWLAQTSARRLYEHLLALKDAGFSFISPMDIPHYLESNKQEFNRATPKPWLARQVDNIKYAFTGRKETVTHEDITPAKVVAVTFDDGIRSSFELGTPIGQELGIPFGMFIIGMLDELNAPMYATWAEIREYMDTGVWEVGSHLYRAHKLMPVGPWEEDVDPALLTEEERERLDRRRKVFPLPNRIWLDERNRLETMREWTGRVRREFSFSKELLVTRLDLSSNEVTAVAYPYGEVGQEEGSNVAKMLNPIRSILNEAIRDYSVGFALDQYGYTFPGDNMMLIRRYEPAWDEESNVLLENVLMNHPVFLARRMRAEIAVLMDKPHLADRQVELLRRDGYPENLLRELIVMTQNKSVSTLVPATDEADRSGTSPWRVKPSNLMLGVGYRENQSNEQILQKYFEIRGGLNITAKIGANAYYRDGSIDQTVKSNYWYTITRDETQASVETRRETVNGVAETRVTQVETVTTREVQTNRVDKYDYSADVQEIRGAVTVNVNDSASLNASVGQKSVKFKTGTTGKSSESEILYSLTVAWRPFRTLQVLTAYDHDLVPSARAIISYDAFVLNALWKVADDWDLNCNAIYYSYDDSNAMFSIFGSSFWQLFARQGIWGGVEASVYSMDEYSELYWTPYWDTRFSGVLRMKRSYQNYFFQFDVRLGMQKEKARPEDESAYLNLKAQADSDGNWYPGSDPNADWDTYIGLTGTYSQRIWRHWDLMGSVNINFLRDYSEHDYIVGVQYNF
ncbi:MAG: tetratricopeptide repeat protein [Verrucomicrobiota bacterium]|jgi:tetratricopeptide (TPR) repeat protein|nr:tetratricopeptide repeat protein [Verrucomicrobiota bacterium]